jgi:hypothetical protein
MAKSRVFTSFDFDHDEDLRNLLIGQAKNPDSPFELADWSLTEAFTGDWKTKIRERLRRVDQVLVLCGTETHRATGVSVELAIGREEKRPYFLLKGRRDQACMKPTAALSTDKMYEWTWDNLKKLIGGAR